MRWMIQEPDVIPTENVVKNTSDPSKSKPKLNKEMIDKYSGVVVKGFAKDVSTNDLLKVFKKAGLPKNCDEDDLQVVTKGNNTTIFIHDLNPESCVKLTQSLHNERISKKLIQVFPLVDESPVKKLGKKLEDLINSCSSDTDEGEMSKTASEKHKISKNTIKTDKNRLWANSDIDLSDESESENPHNRKEQPTECPDLRWNNLTRKQKKKLKKQKLSKSQ